MKLFFGVDVSKDTLDMYYKGKNINLSNNLIGLKKFYSLLQEEIKNGNEISLIICEATGGYETKLVKFIMSKSMPIHVAHANKVRDFARSKGLRAKTDKIDACLLAEYGETMKIQETRKLRTVEQDKLVELLKRREQLKEDRIREVVRLDKELDRKVKKSIKAHIVWLDKEMRIMEDAIKKLQEECESINTKIKLLKSVPAIGDITACHLVAYLPELGQTREAKKICSLAGLAPFVKDSGKYKGKRFIQGGRTAVRKSLYMSALSSVRHYKEMKEFYLRLRGKGKSGKIALIAVARKLLVVLNSVMWRQTPWIEEYTLANKNP